MCGIIGYRRRQTGSAILIDGCADRYRGYDSVAPSSMPQTSCGGAPASGAQEVIAVNLLTATTASATREAAPPPH